MPMNRLDVEETKLEVINRLDMMATKSIQYYGSYVGWVNLVDTDNRFDKVQIPN